MHDFAAASLLVINVIANMAGVTVLTVLAVLVLARIV